LCSFVNDSDEDDEGMDEFDTEQELRELGLDLSAGDAG
jgi:hypothetical protein